MPVLLARGPDAEGRSRTQYKGKIQIAFKQLPLPFHDKAHLAAEAALAANEQGKFWEMHDKLFANQQALDRPSLEKYAAGARPQHGQVQGARSTAASSRTRSTPTPKEGAAVGATGTPTFFINGTKLVGAQPVDAFKTVIDKELKAEGVASRLRPGSGPERDFPIRARIEMSRSRRSPSGPGAAQRRR